MKIRTIETTRTALLVASTLLCSQAFAFTVQAASHHDLIDNLTACAGRLAATKGYDSYIDGLAITRLSSVGALEYLIGGKRMEPSRREAINDFKAEFEKRLISEPAMARSLVAETYKDCSQLVYDAEDVRVEAERADAAATADAARVDAEKRAQAAQEQAMELEKMRLQAEMTIESKRLDLEAAKSGNDVEIAKVNANASVAVESGRTAASVEVAKVNADRDVAIIGKQSEVAVGQTKASVDIAKINADAGVAMVGKAADVAVAKAQAGVAAAKIEADAGVAMVSKIAESENTKAKAAVEVAGKLARVEDGRTKAAVEIANAQASAQVQTAKAARGPAAGLTEVKGGGATAAMQVFDMEPVSSVGSDYSLIADGKPIQVQGIGLGDGPAACATELRTIRVPGSIAGKNAPNSVLIACEFGMPGDQTVAFFSEDGKRVTRVQRDLFVNSKEVDIDRLLSRVRDNFGPSGSFADGGQSLIYASGGKERPRGLKVKAIRCGGTECDGHRGKDTIVSFNLIDVQAFASAVKHGAQNLEGEKAAKTDNIKF